jgi:NAD(P)-dependent dehydrogenase (short-subunit alcohol dehydrogenase family)
MKNQKPGPASFDLTGKVAVVTGGGGALGSEICAGLARAGARVAVVDVRREDAARVAAGIEQEGGKALAIAANVSKEDEVQRLFDEIDGAFQRVDILVNGISAGIDRQQPENVTLADWQHMLETNLTSYFLCTKAAGQQMIKAQRGGSIINISSIGGVNALGRGAMAYGVSKAGIIQLTRETSFAWAHHNIRVNAILPCQFTNSWWAARQADPASQPMVKRVLSAIPLGRLGEAHEIVGPVLFLASEASSMVTGVLLPVDGGNLAMNAGGSHEW